MFYFYFKYSTYIGLDRCLFRFTYTLYFLLIFSEISKKYYNIRKKNNNDVVTRRDSLNFFFPSPLLLDFVLSISILIRECMTDFEKDSV